MVSKSPCSGRIWKSTKDTNTCRPKEEESSKIQTRDSGIKGNKELSEDIGAAYMMDAIPKTEYPTTRQLNDAPIYSTMTEQISKEVVEEKTSEELKPGTSKEGMEEESSSSEGEIEEVDSSLITDELL